MGDLEPPELLMRPRWDRRHALYPTKKNKLYQKQRPKVKIFRLKDLGTLQGVLKGQGTINTPYIHYMHTLYQTIMTGLENNLPAFPTALSGQRSCSFREKSQR